MLDQTQGPQQHQRVNGHVRVGVRQREGRTRLADLYQSGAAKAMLPRTHDNTPVAVLINTAGGLTGGDRLAYDITAGPGTTFSVATQTAERAYRAAEGRAEVSITLDVGANAHLDWLAQETILFEGSALSRRMEVDLAADATALLVEPVIIGRAAMGEVPQKLAFHDRWRIRRDGRLIHGEAGALHGPMSDLRSGAAGLGTATAFATLVYLGADADARAARLTQSTPPDGVRLAQSCWDDRLVLRFLSENAQALRAALINTMTRLTSSPLPRVWTM